MVGAALAYPATARAQDSTRVYRIFWLSTQSQPDPFLDGFREGLRARGYVEGKNLVLELHYAIGNPQALREVASELRRGKVDLAVSSGPATRAMTEVAEVPVLFALSGDPVELGLVKSLGQPGGNFTGSTFLSLELAGKRVELLKEVSPEPAQACSSVERQSSGRAIGVARDQGGRREARHRAALRSFLRRKRT